MHISERETELSESIDYARVRLGAIDGEVSKRCGAIANPETRRCRLHGRIAQETRSIDLQTFDDGWLPPQVRYLELRYAVNAAARGLR